MPYNIPVTCPGACRKQRKRHPIMFNSINNLFGIRVESSTSSDNNGKQKKQQEQKQSEKRQTEKEKTDEIRLGGRPILTEDEIISYTSDYIAKMKSEHPDDEKFAQKADKWLEKFDVSKFMKKNPDITISDFNMIMFMETEFLRK